MPKRTRCADALLEQQGDRCARCAIAIGEGDDFEVDHKVRLADGGTDDLANKHVLCYPCHREKTRRENATIPHTPPDINEFIRSKQANAPRQVHQRYSIQQLRGWWVDGALRNAECNRTPVWEPAKRRAFLATLIEGGITPPIFVNLLRKDGEAREIYDGGNRVTSIMQFFSGELHLQYTLGRRTVLASYATCRVEGCRNGCVPLDPVNRRMLESRMVDVFEWESLSTQAACEMAQHLNEGTPMTIGEKLKLLCGRDVPRARILKYLHDSPSFRALAERDRERDRKVLALFLRNVISPDLTFTSGLTSNFEPLDNFYRSPEQVEEKHVLAAERILDETARLLSARAKTQRNLLICLLGLRRNADVESALLDDDTEASVEDLLERHKGADGPLA
jgi:hypothetical protein